MACFRALFYFLHLLASCSTFGSASRKLSLVFIPAPCIAVSKTHHICSQWALARRLASNTIQYHVTFCSLIEIPCSTYAVVARVLGIEAQAIWLSRLWVLTFPLGLLSTTQLTSDCKNLQNGMATEGDQKSPLLSFKLTSESHYIWQKGGRFLSLKFDSIALKWICPNSLSLLLRFICSDTHRCVQVWFWRQAILITISTSQYHLVPLHEHHKYQKEPFFCFLFFHVSDWH